MKPTREKKPHPELFTGLVETALSDLKVKPTELYVKKRQVIYPQGDPAEYGYIIKEGGIALRHYQRDGELVIVRIVGVNELIGFSPIIEGCRRR